MKNCQYFLCENCRCGSNNPNYWDHSANKWRFTVPKKEEKILLIPLSRINVSTDLMRFLYYLFYFQVFTFQDWPSLLFLWLLYFKLRLYLTWNSSWLDSVPSGPQQKPSFVRFNYFQWSKKCCSRWGPFLLKISNIMPGIHWSWQEVGTGMENVNEPEMVNNESNLIIYLLRLSRGVEDHRIVFTTTNISILND